MANWTREDFDRAMRSGETPDGRLLDRSFMPWPSFAGLDTLEIDALWLYLSGGASGTSSRETDVAALQSRLIGEGSRDR